MALAGRRNRGSRCRFRTTRKHGLAALHGAVGFTAHRQRPPFVIEFHHKADRQPAAQQRGLDFSLTHSCYDPDAAGRPCGQCDSCLLRRKGFEEAAIADC